MAYLRASGERLTELRHLTVHELYRDYQIVKRQQDAEYRRREKQRLEMQQRMVRR